MMMVDEEYCNDVITLMLRCFFHDFPSQKSVLNEEVR